jgi:hypothetical protein
MTSVPPLAGLCSYDEAVRTGASVDEAVELLRRLGRIERRVSLVLAVHLSSVPEWEVKCGLALQLWQDTEHCAWMRERVAQMRKPPHYLDRADDPALEAFFEELIRSRTTRELLTGLYAVLKPSVVAAAEAYRERASPLADQPTFRLLRFAAIEERDQIEWGRQALAALGGEDAEWRAHLDAYLRAAGGADGRAESEPGVPAPRAPEPLEPARVPRRDERFPQLWGSRGRAPAPDAPIDERVMRLFYVRSGEMELAEMLALALFEWPDAPFDVHRDLARHLWDECRHSMLGEAALESRGIDWRSLPQPISLAAYPGTALEPKQRYALIYGIEAPLMRREADSDTTAGIPASKPAQYELAVESGDPLAALVQNFDWADEVLHVQLARRVLARAYASTVERDRAADEAVAGWEAVLQEDIALERSDWWDAFYARVKASR